MLDESSHETPDHYPQNPACLTLHEIRAEREAEIALQEGKAALLLSLPPNFTSSLRGGNAVSARLGLSGDPMTDMDMFAERFLVDAAGAFADAQTGWTRPMPARLEFLPNPAPTLFALAGHSIGGFDFLPTTHAMLALQ